MELLHSIQILRMDKYYQIFGSYKKMTLTERVTLLVKRVRGPEKILLSTLYVLTRLTGKLILHNTKPNIIAQPCATVVIGSAIIA